MKHILSVGVVLSFLLLGLSTAYPFRCGNKAIHVGDSKFMVSQKCGEPVSKESMEKKVEVQYGSGQAQAKIIKVEQWIYDMGPGSFYYRLTFEDGILVEIKPIGRHK